MSEQSKPFSYLLITGACGGLGSAFATECAGRGYNLILSDLNSKGFEFSAALAERYGIDAVFRQCDLTDPFDRFAMYREFEERGYTFHGIINVAGLDNEGGVLDRNRDQLLQIVRINIESTLDTTRALLSMRDRERKFRILNVSSMAAFYPMPFKAVYAASKRFILDFSLALGEEIRGFGTVTALCPAGMRTNPQTIRSIESQGFWGRITTLGPEKVADYALNAMMRGRRIIVPGIVNRFIVEISRFVPLRLKIRTVFDRWSTARKKTELIS